MGMFVATLLHGAVFTREKTHHIKRLEVDGQRGGTPLVSVLDVFKQSEVTGGEIELHGFLQDFSTVYTGDTSLRKRNRVIRIYIETFVGDRESCTRGGDVGNALEAFSVDGDTIIILDVLIKEECHGPVHI